ncbi:MAG: RNA methyltransferase [Deltaproteobacteria bacterium]|nr:RNA methyltransferase [Deltaproteobacteria bacterium]
MKGGSIDPNDDAGRAAPRAVANDAANEKLLRVERVAALGDPRLADYRNLKDAALLRDRGRFVVEGRANLLVLLERSHMRPESILLSEAAFGALGADLARLAGGVPIFVADQSVLDGVVGFSVHRGALAACPRPPSTEPEVLAREVLDRFDAPRVVVLEDVRDADNVGAIFRNAMALGARAVFLGGHSCDPLYRKAIRTSIGGSLCVPFARTEDAPAFLGRLREFGFAVLAFDPKETGHEVDSLRHDRPGPAALVVGTEGPGLTAAALAQASRRIRIAMEPGVDSLNVATAVAIGLHALRPPADPSGGQSEVRSAGGSRGE